MSVVPEFKILSAGDIEVTLPNTSSGNIYKLPGEASADAEAIVHSFKDAIVAAILNKCGLKIKLFDAKDDNGAIVETVLRAEYNRDDMVPINIWSNPSKGEAGSLATVLRQIITAETPDLAA